MAALKPRVCSLVPPVDDVVWECRGGTLRWDEVMMSSWLMRAEDMMLPDAGIGSGTFLQSAPRSELWPAPSKLAVVSCYRPRESGLRLSGGKERKQRLVA